MAYNKKTWTSKEIITKEALNNIENGISQLDDNQANFLTQHQDISHLATKGELFSGNYNDLTNKPYIPSLDGYATENYVKNEIANAQLGGDGNDVDLSGISVKLYGKDELQNVAKLHFQNTKKARI